MAVAEVVLNIPLRDLGIRYSWGPLRVRVNKGVSGFTASQTEHDFPARP